MGGGAFIQPQFVPGNTERQRVSVSVFGRSPGLRDAYFHDHRSTAHAAIDPAGYTSDGERQGFEELIVQALELLAAIASGWR